MYEVTDMASMREAMRYYYEASTLAGVAEMLAMDAHYSGARLAPPQALRRAKKAVCALYTGRTQRAALADAFESIDLAIGWTGMGVNP